jgi:ribosomal protein L7Ae-like RNA K-turn-binding protein
MKMALDKIERSLSLLGMARKARELIVGPDRVFRAIKDGRKLFVITSVDCSENILRKTRSAAPESFVFEGISRESLGRGIGVMSAQIVALPCESGFVKKLKELLKWGGTLNE